MGALRLALGGVVVASFAAFASVPGGCADASFTWPEAGAEAAPMDAMGCWLGGRVCHANEECCSGLCMNERCADPQPVPPGPPCPGEPPAAGEGCLANGVACEYGTSPVVSCDEVVTCKDWQWQVSDPDSADPACAPSPTWCPTSLSDVHIGQSCGAPTAHCDYAGVRCECAQNASVAGWPASWKCPAESIFPGPTNLGGPLDPGCPSERPRLGTACGNLDQTCDYGACQIRGGIRQACVYGGVALGQGIWVEQPVDCTCPATLPDAGDLCTNPSISCEYGPSNVAVCNTTMMCTSAFNTSVRPTYRWQRIPTTNDGGPPCAPAPASQCPAPGASIDGLPCSTPSLDCDYIDLRCECVVGPGAEPAATWKCTDPRFAGPGCGPRPRVGTLCPQEGQVCDYGVCEIAGGSAEVCNSNGWWQEGTLPTLYQCPLACPHAPPEAGSQCSPLGVCEYGTSNVFQCDTIAVCWYLARQPQSLPPGAPPFFAPGWLVSNSDAGGKSCQPSSPSLCPPSFDAIVRDAGCDGAPPFCDYAQGRCRCATAPGASAGSWSCQDPAPTCPQPRPRLGTACTRAQEGLICAYDPCDGVAGFAEKCQQSVWIRLDVSCGDAGSD